MSFQGVRVDVPEILAITCLLSVCSLCVEVLNAVKCCFTVISVNQSQKLFKTQVEHGGTSCVIYLSFLYLTNWLCFAH